MKYDLSICLPAIRTRNWKKLYDTACNSVGKYSFEMVFVSPYDLPPELEGVDNVRVVKDFGAPTRCFQMGAISCLGELITAASDDGVFVKGSLEEAIDLYKQQCQDGDGVIVRYTEGQVCHLIPMSMQAFHTGLLKPILLYVWQESTKSISGVYF